MPVKNERAVYEKMGYRFVGNHTAIKICEWCRRSLGEKGFCYKQKFYGIMSHRCMQMSPAVFSCTENCVFCWRAMRFSMKNTEEKWDSPVDIVNGCIEEQRKIIQGFGGNKRTNPVKLYEAERPNQVAISLSGEPMLYPHIGELISEFHKRKMTTFLVSNGTLPDKIKLLHENDQQPTQLYITVGASNKKVFQKTVKPMLPDAWERLQETLGVINKFNKSVIRLTLAKNINMTDPEGYARLADKSAPMFFEIKGFVSVGGARTRIPYDSMPTHSEVRSFAECIEKHSSYHITDEKEDSRVVLLKR
jgi:tRNA wybutosine-synthesizing protein 1